MKPVILQYLSKVANSIGDIQEPFRNKQVEAELRNIHENYSILVDAIKILQNSCLSLSASLEIVDSVIVVLQNLIDASDALAVEKHSDV